METTGPVAAILEVGPDLSSAHETVEILVTGTRIMGEGAQHGEETQSLCTAWCGVVRCARGSKTIQK
jgi:hypothetical protein